MNVGILSSIHPVSDTRVFHKEAKSLLKAGHDVTFIAPHPRNESIDGIKIIAVKKFASRLKRMTGTVFQVLKKALRLNADIYHFHDPELIPAGIILKIRGKKVIYDVHEYYREKIRSKTYLPSALRPIIAFLYDAFENISSLIFDAVIVTDDVTAAKFWSKTTLIANFPYLPDSALVPKKSGSNGEFKVIYAGGLTSNRGLFKMIEAIGHVKISAKLLLVGDFKSMKDKEKAGHYFTDPKIQWLGHRPWPETISILASSNAGLAVFQPVPGYSYYGINVVKLFEYMMLGLPVIVSDFPNLRTIVQETGCGILVDPTDSQQIANAIEYLHQNPSEAVAMGNRARQAVKERFNWASEEIKLLNLYRSLSSNAPSERVL